MANGDWAKRAIARRAVVVEAGGIVCVVGVLTRKFPGGSNDVAGGCGVVWFVRGVVCPSMVAKVADWVWWFLEFLNRLKFQI